MKKAFFVLLFLTGGLLAKAQVNVSGVVTDATSGEGIPGATVQIKGTTNGTITNFDGTYNLQVPSSESILIYSFVGFTTQEISVGNASSIDVVLELGVEELEELVVVGYGTQRKKEVTGSVGSVNSKEIVKTATSDLGNAIQGQIAGVSVQASSGTPGANANIIIRGVGSANGNVDPLYVVDGIPYADNPNLVPEEIESITVLKDGAAAAVYGTRASNGVILITTKTAKEQALKVNYSMYAGVQSIFSGVPLMTGAETLYAEEVEERQLTGQQSEKIVLSPGSLERETDFIGSILNDNAPIQNHNITVTKGFENFNVSWINNYYQQEGVLIKSNYERLSSRLNTNYFKGRFEASLNLAVEVDDTETAPGENNNNVINMYQEAIAQRPYQPLPESLSTDTVQLPFENPQNIGGFAGSLTEVNTSESTDWNGALNLKYEIMDGLFYQVRAGGNITTTNSNFFSPRFIIIAQNDEVENLSSRPNILNNSSESTFTKWTVENILTYKRTIGEHAFTGNLAYTREKFVFENSAVNVTETPDTTIVANPAPFKSENSLIGALARLQYSFRDKYFVSLSLRRDGSSNFGPENRYGYFPGASFGWNISDEAFFNVDPSILSNLKLRASFAEVGNQSIPQYQFSALIFDGSNYTFGREGNPNFIVGASQRSIPNPAIQWETNVTRNIGVDATFLDNKLNLTLDLYRNSKQDMLLNVPPPPSAGVVIPAGGTFTQRFQNIGDMVNEGIELTLGYTHIKGDFSSNLSAVFTKNTNTVEKLAEGQGRFSLSGGSPTPGGANTTFLVEGHEVASFFLIPTEGTIKTQAELDDYLNEFPASNALIGDLRYVDRLTEDTNGDGLPDSGDGVLNDNDRVFMGSGTPEFEIGFNGSFGYKRFDLAFQLFYSHGAEIYNGAKAYGYQTARHRDIRYQWQPANPESNVPSLRRNGGHPNFMTWSDQFLEDGTYLRMRLVTVGYNVPIDFIKSKNETLRIYFSAQNLFTITDYSGFDPEIGFSNSFYNRGVDQGNYPVARRFIGGLQFNF
ncbi:MAG: SusC/RagA family TonB-linked outer membrane protein [Bacteroidota bacterium]